MDLESNIWKTIDGGDNTLYDASVPLKRLLLTNVPDELETVFTELWDNLHHQGDIGLASYLSVPQLVKICINKKSLDWNFVGLCLLIENCRQAEHNPELPPEF